MSLAPILQLARDRYYWWPPRLARIVWAVTTHIRPQLEIFQILAQPVFKGLVLSDPRLPFKYLTRDYLARGFTVAERASCFMHHYRYLSARLPADLLRQTLYRDVTILEMEEGGNLYCIKMCLAKHEIREGELFLKLEVNGDAVFVLQFTIVRGWVVESRALHVLLVTRIQGMKGCYSQIQLATKAFQDVSPAFLLFAALQGVAEALGIKEMAGVAATSQYSYSEDFRDIFNSAYDDFYASLEANRSTGRFFSIPIPLSEKPLVSIRNGHKTRTKKKRAFKQKIANDVCRLFRERCEIAAPSQASNFDRLAG